MKTRYYIAALIALSLLSLAIIGVRPARGAEEPTPGVARVSLVHGEVTTMRGDSGDWVEATVNAPVVQGDKISTGDRSQTEIQLDYANVIRLAPRSEARIADLTRTQIQVQLAQGLMNLTVLKGSEADVEIDTPNVAVRPLKEGSYRIQVSSENETLVIVRKGEAEVSTPKGSTLVRKGELITVRGVEEPEYQIAKAPGKDEWDEWNHDRDNEIRDARSWRYANHYYTGAHDLDNHGRWTYVPGYDWCWTPYVNSGWVPYRDGRWLWEPYWGWTWVSYEPWGWAPYHYGRWFWNANNWCWWPGYSYYGYYPTWAPAYVSFIGFGFGRHNWGFGFGFGFGSIGWLPLGPYDYYSPWYGYHNTYNVVNITNITNITNINNVTNRAGNNGNRGYGSNIHGALNNPRVREAITRVSSEDFVRGRIPRNSRGVDLETLRQGQVVRGTLPAVPTRESLRPTDRVVNAAAGRGARAENFFHRRQPPAGPRPFNERATEIQRMVERHNPLQASGGESVASRGQAGGARDAATISARGGAGQARLAPAEGEPLLAQGGTTGGAQRGQGEAAQPAPSSDRSGWQRFGTGRPRATAGRPVSPGQSTEVRPRQESRPEGTTRPEAAPARRSTERPGWQRFGTGSARPQPSPSRTRETEAQRAPQGAPRETGTSRSRPAPEATGRSSWDRFSTAPRGGRQTPARAESRESGGAEAAPRTSTSRPAPSGGGERPTSSDGQSRWERFSPRGGESRQVERRESAPRSSERPPLEIRKPIVTDRPAPPRSFQGGDNRGWSAPSGVNRGWSSPSRSSGYSTPSYSPRSFSGGGSRSGSAPPSGGSRGWSAPPSGGSRGWSGPSGGGRSAPSSSPPSSGGGGSTGGGSRGGGFSGGSRGHSGGSSPRPGPR